MTAPVGEHHLGRLAELALERVPDHQSVFCEGQWHSSHDLGLRARRAASGLSALGVRPGDRVVVLMMNAPEVGIAYNAVWRAGAVVTPVLFLITPPELRHVLTDSGAVAAVVTPELLPLLQSASEGLDLKVLLVGGEVTGDVLDFAEVEAHEPGELVARADDDLAALLYTGGTTGRSKGVMLTHLGLWSSGGGLHQSSKEMQAARALLPLPLSHAYGLIVTISGMHGTDPRVSVLQRWFDAPSWVDLVEEHRIETSPVVPSMLTMLLALPLEDRDLSCLRYFGSGGAPLSLALREEVARRLPAVEIFEGYGCTESSAVVSASRVGANRIGSVGRALPHAKVRILDPDGRELGPGQDGEICVSGPGVMAGYWNAPELTAETVVDGELHTGDVGHLDEDGYLYVVDRIKDLIIRGGFNVYPRDVEDVLLQHPQIASAAVVGRPDELHGEEVVALVALSAGATLTAEEVVAFTKERLAANKYPREVHVVDAVPLTSVGKTDRKAARQLVRSGSLDQQAASAPA